MYEDSIRLGIDLGGTKIELIALDSDGNEIYRHRISTPQGDYEKTLQSICKLVQYAESHLDTYVSIGICTPGSLSPKSGLLRNSNSLCLNNKPFLEDISLHLQREVRIANDANCFTLSESIDGNAAHADTVFGVIIGTGCGGGIVVNKQLIAGPNKITGEWGHNPLPCVNNKIRTECWCGKENCIETYLSGPGFTADFARADGSTKKAEDILMLAEQGNSLAIQCLELYERRLACSLASIINVLDPDVIILGGGMSNIQRLYKNVPKLWHEYVFSDSVTTELLPPKHGDSSGVRGAAWLWNN